MKKIYRNLVAAFVAAASILFISLSAGLIQVNYSVEKANLKEITEQVLENIKVARQNYEKKLALMEEVWLEWGRNAEYILSKEAGSNLDDVLRRMRVVIGAKDLYVFDQKGRVWASTDQNAIGKPLEGEEELLKNLVGKDSGEDYYIHIEESGFWEDPSYCRLVLKASSEGFSAICIDADTTQMGLKCEKTLIENTLLETATEYNTSVAAIGEESGVILGMTKNNSQAIKIQGRDSREELLKFLEQGAEGGHMMTVINGEPSLVAVTKADGEYIMAFTLMNKFLYGILRMIFIAFLLFLAAVAAVIYTINYNFKKYLLKHFEDMEQRLNRLLGGDFSVSLEEVNNPEINKLIRVIEQLKVGYVHKSERTDTILDALGENIAVFECVSEINFYFFSEKMKQLLSMTDQEWDEAQKKKSRLLKLIQDLNAQKDESGIVNYRGKYLMVQVSDVEREDVGVVIDQTDEISRRYALESEIRRFEKKLGTDPLTRMLNRGGFEACVKKYLAETQDEGILIAFDLDNFKKINDTLGHPKGDEVLKLYAKGLRDLFRKEDIIGRLGGDEFFVFLTNMADLDAAKKKVEYILKELNKRFGEYHSRYGVSASAGLALALGGEDYDHVYQMADQALYEAKKAGKNCCHVYGKDHPNP